MDWQDGLHDLLGLDYLLYHFPGLKPSASAGLQNVHKRAGLRGFDGLAGWIT